jgi:hypothetical protein
MNVPLPIALVHKLDDINEGVETNHSKLINEELLKLSSRFQNEIARVELSLNKSKEIQELWNAIGTVRQESVMSPTKSNYPQ